MSDLKLNVEGAMKLMDERDALRAALQEVQRVFVDYFGLYVNGKEGTYIHRPHLLRPSEPPYKAAAAVGKALALGKGEPIFHAGSHGKSAPLNPASSASGGTAVDDLLTDLLDYFEPKIDADIDGTGKAMSNAEMKLYQRIKQIRGER